MDEIKKQLKILAVREKRILARIDNLNNAPKLKTFNANMNRIFKIGNLVQNFMLILLQKQALLTKPVPKFPPGGPVAMITDKKGEPINPTVRVYHALDGLPDGTAVIIRKYKI